MDEIKFNNEEIEQLWSIWEEDFQDEESYKTAKLMFNIGFSTAVKEINIKNKQIKKQQNMRLSDYLNLLMLLIASFWLYSAIKTTNVEFIIVNTITVTLCVMHFLIKINRLLKK